MNVYYGILLGLIKFLKKIDFRISILYDSQVCSEY